MGLASTAAAPQIFSEASNCYDGLSFPDGINLICQNPTTLNKVNGEFTQSFYTYTTTKMLDDACIAQAKMSVYESETGKWEDQDIACTFSSTRSICRNSKGVSVFSNRDDEVAAINLLYVGMEGEGSPNGSGLSGICSIVDEKTLNQFRTSVKNATTTAPSSGDAICEGFAESFMCRDGKYNSAYDDLVYQALPADNACKQLENRETYHSVVCKNFQNATTGEQPLTGYDIFTPDVFNNCLFTAKQNYSNANDTGYDKYVCQNFESYATCFRVSSGFGNIVSVGEVDSDGQFASSQIFSWGLDKDQNVGQNIGTCKWIDEATYNKGDLSDLEKLWTSSENTVTTQLELETAIQNSGLCDTNIASSYMCNGHYLDNARSGNHSYTLDVEYVNSCNVVANVVMNDETDRIACSLSEISNVCLNNRHMIVADRNSNNEDLIEMYLTYETEDGSPGSATYMCTPALRPTLSY